MIEQRKRQTSKPFGSRTHCSDWGCAFSPQMQGCEWHTEVPENLMACLFRQGKRLTPKQKLVQSHKESSRP